MYTFTKLSTWIIFFFFFFFCLFFCFHLSLQWVWLKYKSFPTFNSDFIYIIFFFFFFRWTLVTFCKISKKSLVQCEKIFWIKFLLFLFNFEIQKHKKDKKIKKYCIYLLILMRKCSNQIYIFIYFWFLTLNKLLFLFLNKFIFFMCNTRFMVTIQIWLLTKSWPIFFFYYYFF